MRETTLFGSRSAEKDDARGRRIKYNSEERKGLDESGNLGFSGNHRINKKKIYKRKRKVKIRGGEHNCKEILLETHRNNEIHGKFTERKELG